MTKCLVISILQGIKFGQVKISRKFPRDPNKGIKLNFAIYDKLSRIFYFINQVSILILMTNHVKAS